MKTKEIIRKDRIRILLIVLCIIIVSIFAINCYVVLSIKSKIISSEDYKKNGYFQCIVVLGGGIRGNQPSPLLQDRLDKAIELYFIGLAPKIIMSGDDSGDKHNEVKVMKNYAIEKGVPSQDIFLDHEGYSTYDTMYRLKNAFGVKKALIVTNRYHLYRSIYIANSMGINAYGVAADTVKRKWPITREVREVLARDKDFFKCILKSSDDYFGDRIDITSNGDVTNEK